MWRFLSTGPWIIICILFLSLHLNAQTVPNVHVIDEFGKKGLLLEKLEKEGLLVLGFYECRHICHFMTKNLRTKLRKLKTYPKVVFLSVDEKEGPLQAFRERKKVVAYERSRWSFLVSDRLNIHELVRTLNFSMRRDPVTDKVIHELAVFMIKDGKVVNKITDVNFSEAELQFSESRRDVTHLIKEFCSEFDPRKSKYGAVIMRTLMIACGLFLMGFVYMYYRIWKKA